MRGGVLHLLLFPCASMSSVTLLDFAIAHSRVLMSFAIAFLCNDWNVFEQLWVKLQLKLVRDLQISSSTIMIDSFESFKTHSLIVFDSQKKFLSQKTIFKVLFLSFWCELLSLLPFLEEERTILQNYGDFLVIEGL